MADIAQLGFMVNTSGLALGKSAMGAYAEKGRKTEKEITTYPFQLRSIQKLSKKETFRQT